MKLNLAATITDLDNQPLMDGGKPITMRKICVDALMTPQQDDNPSGEEKLARYVLAGKLHAGGEVDVTPEDAAKLKTLIGKMYTALVVGRAYELLNG